jgi:hypothetical protein
MKKLIALFTVLLIVTGAAFAQVADGISIGGGAQLIFAPVQGQFGNDRAYFGAGLGGWGANVNVTFAAADGRVGGQAKFDRGTNTAKYTSVVDSGNVNAWVKPFASDILYVKVGKYEHDDFRGKVGTDSNFHSFIGGPGKGPDRIFQRLNARGTGGGGLVVIKPVSGLSLFADIGTGWGTFTKGVTADTPKNGGQDTYKNIQAGIAYDISGIGLFRAQWVGNTMDIVAGKPTRYEIDPATYNGQSYPSAGGSTVGWKLVKGDTNPYVFNPARIEAAFNLKAVEGLNLDLSVKVPIPVEKEIPRSVGGIDFNAKVVHQDNFQLAAAGEYKAGDFGVVLGLYGEFGGSIAVGSVPAVIAESAPNGYLSKAKLAPSFNIIATPSFYVAAVDATVGADVGFAVTGKGTRPGWLNTLGTWSVADEETTTFGFGGWIKRDLGKGSIKTGLAYQLPAYGAKGTVDEVSYLTWPIILEYSF